MSQLLSVCLVACRLLYCLVAAVSKSLKKKKIFKEREKSMRAFSAPVFRDGGQGGCERLTGTSRGHTSAGPVGSAEPLLPSQRDLSTSLA